MKKEMKKYRFICVIDCCVMDEPYIKYIEADSIEEADQIAWEMSTGTGLSEGNYQLFVDTMYVKDDGLTTDNLDPVLCAVGFEV